MLFIIGFQVGKFSYWKSYINIYYFIILIFNKGNPIGESAL